MKKKFLIALVFVLLLYPLSYGNSEEKKAFALDGYQWNRMLSLEKLGFVAGWLEAWESISWAMLSLQFEIQDPTPGMRIINTFQFKECLRITEKAMEAKGLNLENFTLGQISDTISKIYSDPRVKKWEIMKIMPIVYGRLNKGWTEREIDEVIAFYIKLNDLTNRSVGIVRSKNDAELNRHLEELKSLESNKPAVLKALEKYQ